MRARGSASNVMGQQTGKCCGVLMWVLHSQHRSFVLENTVAQAIGNVALGWVIGKLLLHIERYGQHCCRGHRINGNRLGHWKMVVGVVIVVHAVAYSTVGATYSNTGTSNAWVTTGAAVNLSTTGAVGVGDCWCRDDIKTTTRQAGHTPPAQVTLPPRVVTNIGGADSAWNGITGKP